jgi:hypothetical protein
MQNVYNVLLKFRDNWFAPNHLFKISKTLYMFLFKSVSSAKIIGVEILFIILGKSFV